MKAAYWSTWVAVASSSRTEALIWRLWVISSSGMLVLLGVQNSNSLNKIDSGRGDVGGAVSRKSRIARFQALDHRCIIDAFTNPLNGGRHVHGPMRVIVRVRFV